LGKPELLQMVVTSNTGCAGIEVADGAMTGMFTMDNACAATTPRQFQMCFAMFDGEAYGPESCADFEVIDFDCGRQGYTTFEECFADERCFWDRNGIDEFHADGPRGCYNFVQCSQLDESKRGGRRKESCHMASLQQCIHTPFEAEPKTEENPHGDPCRAFDKKSCRQVDGHERSEQYMHCEWNALNEWCPPGDTFRARRPVPPDRQQAGVQEGGAQRLPLQLEA